MYEDPMYLVNISNGLMRQREPLQKMVGLKQVRLFFTSKKKKNYFYSYPTFHIKIRFLTFAVIIF